MPMMIRVDADTHPPFVFTSSPQNLGFRQMVRLTSRAAHGEPERHPSRGFDSHRQASTLLFRLERYAGGIDPNASVRRETS